MNLEYIPLLHVQRDLYRLPRGWERFQEYLATMVDPETRDIKLPLSGMNPMGKDHIPALLDQYLALEADQVAAQITTEALSDLAEVPGDMKVALVISDDAQGGWTNRYSTEFSHRFEPQAYLKRGWLVGILWTSESPSVATLREAVLTTMYRFAYIHHHGFAHTLGEMLAQEGYAMARAGCTGPRLDSEELAYTKMVIEPHLSTTSYPLLIACLFGDEGANSLGYQPPGLSHRAGLALALEMARWQDDKMTR